MSVGFNACCFYKPLLDGGRLKVGSRPTCLVFFLVNVLIETFLKHTVPSQPVNLFLLVTFTNKIKLPVSYRQVLCLEQALFLTTQQLGYQDNFQVCFCLCFSVAGEGREALGVLDIVSLKSLY